MNVLLCLLGLAAGSITPTSVFNVSTPAGAWTAPLKVVFWNFDKTLPVASVGHNILNLCGGPNYFVDCGCKGNNNCTTYNLSAVAGGVGQCACTVGNLSLTNYWMTNYLPTYPINDTNDFNGTDRLQRINQTLNTLAAAGVRNVILSTGWWYVTATMWADFLVAYFQQAGLQMFFNASTIYTLDDPGCNIAANKGGVAQAYMASNGWTQHNGLYVDKSTSNVANVSAFTDTLLQWAPTTGVALDQLAYIEAWAAYTVDLMSSAPTNAPTSAPNAPTSAPNAPTSAPNTGSMNSSAPSSSMGAPSSSKTSSAVVAVPTFFLTWLFV